MSWFSSVASAVFGSAAPGPSGAVRAEAASTAAAATWHELQRSSELMTVVTAAADRWSGDTIGGTEFYDTRMSLVDVPDPSDAQVKYMRGLRERLAAYVTQVRAIIADKVEVPYEQLAALARTQIGTAVALRALTALIKDEPRYTPVVRRACANGHAELQALEGECAASRAAALEGGGRRSYKRLAGGVLVAAPDLLGTYASLFEAADKFYEAWQAQDPAFKAAVRGPKGTPPPIADSLHELAALAEWTRTMIKWIEGNTDRMRRFQEEARSAMAKFVDALGTGECGGAFNARETRWIIDRLQKEKCSDLLLRDFNARPRAASEMAADTAAALDRAFVEGEEANKRLIAAVGGVAAAMSKTTLAAEEEAATASATVASMLTNLTGEGAMNMALASAVKNEPEIVASAGTNLVDIILRNGASLLKELEVRAEALPPPTTGDEHLLVLMATKSAVRIAFFTNLLAQPVEGLGEAQWGRLRGTAAYDRFKGSFFCARVVFDEMMKLSAAESGLLMHAMRAYLSRAAASTRRLYDVDDTKLGLEVEKPIAGGCIGRRPVRRRSPKRASKRASKRSSKTKRTSKRTSKTRRTSKRVPTKTSPKRTSRRTLQRKR